MNDLFYASSYDEFILDNKKGDEQSKVLNKTKSNNRDGNIYDSMMKVIKSTAHEVKEYRQLFNFDMLQYYIDSKLVFKVFYLIQPVIIFKGHMFGHTQGACPENKRIKFAQLPKKYISKNYRINTGSIHVVSYESLEEYLSLLSDFYNE
jgi:hypothetical protein